VQTFRKLAQRTLSLPLKKSGDDLRHAQKMRDQGQMVGITSATAIELIPNLTIISEETNYEQYPLQT
jgi:hypothetical protein